MANPRDNLTDSEKERWERDHYNLWLTWELPVSSGPNRQWFRSYQDREEFADIFRDLGAKIEMGEVPLNIAR